MRRRTNLRLPAARHDLEPSVRYDMQRYTAVHQHVGSSTAARGLGAADAREVKEGPLCHHSWGSVTDARTAALSCFVSNRATGTSNAAAATLTCSRLSNSHPLIREMSS